MYTGHFGSKLGLNFDVVDGIRDRRECATRPAHYSEKGLEIAYSRNVKKKKLSEWCTNFLNTSSHTHTHTHTHTHIYTHTHTHILIQCW